jgi:hypothetical protein
VFGLAEVELVHRWYQAGCARWAVEQHGELLGDMRVLEAGGGNHVVDTLPHLVEAVDARPVAALQQRLKLWRRAAQYERWHALSLPADSLGREVCRGVPRFARVALSLDRFSEHAAHQ